MSSTERRRAALHHSVEEDVLRFRDVFDRAVAARMPDESRIGVLLSGGLDSSSVMGSAVRARRACTRESPLGVSAVFPTMPSADETTYIGLVHEMHSTKAVQAAVDVLTPLDCVRSVVAAHDEPPWIPNLFMMWSGTFPAARQAGVDVLLTGCDGDTVVSDGTGRIHDLLWSGQFKTLARELRRQARSTSGRARVLWQEGLVPRIPRVVRKVRRRFRGADAGPPQLLRRDVAQRAGVSRFLDEREKRYGSARNAQDAHWLSVMDGINSYEVEMLERTAASHGLELSHPFYDRHVIEHALCVDTDRKVRNGETRWILREAMADVLPPEVRHRSSKSNLSECFAAGMRRDAARANEMIARHRDRIERFVDVDAVARVQERYKAQQQRFDALAIWKTAMFGEWLEYSELS
jgi:asparagine synthase (glutamine-hydrolysing)